MIFSFLTTEKFPRAYGTQIEIRWIMNHILCPSSLNYQGFVCNMLLTPDVLLTHTIRDLLLPLDQSPRGHFRKAVFSAHNAVYAVEQPLYIFFCMLKKITNPFPSNPSTVVLGKRCDKLISLIKNSIQFCG